VALLGSLLAAGATLSVRSILLHAHGPDANGFYQAMSGLTLQILPVFLSGISLYVVPKLGGSNDRGYAGDVLTRVVRIILLLVTPGLALGVVFREQFFLVLFSHEFVRASAWFPVQLTGDLFLALAWAAGSHLLQMGRLRAFLICETVRAALMLAVGAGLLRMGLDEQGIGALAVAHGVSYAAEAGLFLWLARRDVGLSLVRFIPLFLTAGIAWGAVAAAGYLLPPVWRLAVWGLATSFLWGFGITREERAKLLALVVRRRATAP
jgi:PST family polysaccharide transporter